MARHILLVMSNPAAGRDDEFNDWYTNVHLHDVLAVDGIVAAQRFRLSDTQMRPDQPQPHRYMAVYEIEAEDPNTPLQSLLAGVMSGAIPLDESLDVASLSTFAFTPITGRVTP
jgi:hypothetical protein